MKGIGGSRGKSHDRAARIVTDCARSLSLLAAAVAGGVVSLVMTRMIAARVVIMRMLAVRVRGGRRGGVESDVRRGINRQPTEGQNQAHRPERDHPPQAAEGTQRGVTVWHRGENSSFCERRQALPTPPAAADGAG